MDPPRRRERREAGGDMQVEGAIPPQLQHAWARRLVWHYDFYNDFSLQGARRRPLIITGAPTEQPGRGAGARRAITISFHHILADTWESVLETLRHEMAHQFVEDVLFCPGAEPHGEAFARACRALRVEPRATAPSGAPRDAERAAMLQRVRELLAMAGSPNEHEAATAMRLANKYLLKYNLSLAEASGDGGGAGEPRFSVRHLGKPSARINEYEYTLGAILKDHFFVEPVWIFSYAPRTDRPGRILQIAGTPENLEMAEYVYRYIMSIAEPLWRAHRRQAGGGTRARYLAGLLSGFQEKLESQKVQLREEHGLVWKGDPLLRQYYRYMNPRTEKRGFSGVLRGDDFHAGHRDGKEITLRRGIGGEASSRGRLLE
jgi:hypothetical protein